MFFSFDLTDNQVLNKHIETQRLFKDNFIVDQWTSHLSFPTYTTLGEFMAKAYLIHVFQKPRPNSR